MPAEKQELIDAMHRLADALMFMRGPTGELLFVGEKLPQIAWHLARAGADVHPDRAVIKARAVPNRPGQMAGMRDWVPVDWPDPEPIPGSELVTAVGDEVDLDAMFDAMPWQVRTKFEGTFK